MADDQVKQQHIEGIRIKSDGVRTHVTMPDGTPIPGVVRVELVHSRAGSAPVVTLTLKKAVVDMVGNATLIEKE